MAAANVAARVGADIGMRMLYGAGMGAAAGAAWGIGPGDFSLQGVLGGAAMGAVGGLAGRKLGNWGMPKFADKMSKSTKTVGFLTKNMGLVFKQHPPGRGYSGAFDVYSNKAQKSGMRFGQKSLQILGKNSVINTISYGKFGAYAGGIGAGVAGLGMGNSIWSRFKARRRRPMNTLNRYGAGF